MTRADAFTWILNSSVDDEIELLIKVNHIHQIMEASKLKPCNSKRQLYNEAIRTCNAINAVLEHRYVK